MHQDESIIINPVEHTRSTDKKKPNQSKYFTYTDATKPPHDSTQATTTTQREPTAQAESTYQTAMPQEPTPTTAHAIPSQQQASSKSRLSGVAQIVGGGACALVGIPLLVLPGPGLLAIGGGVALMARGAKTLLAPR